MVFFSSLSLDRQPHSSRHPEVRLSRQHLSYILGCARAQSARARARLVSPFRARVRSLHFSAIVFAPIPVMSAGELEQARASFDCNGSMIRLRVRIVSSRRRDGRRRPGHGPDRTPLQVVLRHASRVSLDEVERDMTDDGRTDFIRRLATFGADRNNLALRLPVECAARLLSVLSEPTVVERLPALRSALVLASTSNAFVIQKPALMPHTIMELLREYWTRTHRRTTAPSPSWNGPPVPPPEAVLLWSYAMAVERRDSAMMSCFVRTVLGWITTATATNARLHAPDDEDPNITLRHYSGMHRVLSRAFGEDGRGLLESFRMTWSLPPEMYASGFSEPRRKTSAPPTLVVGIRTEPIYAPARARPAVGSVLNGLVSFLDVASPHAIDHGTLNACYGWLSQRCEVEDVIEMIETAGREGSPLLGSSSWKASIPLPRTLWLRLYELCGRPDFPRQLAARLFTCMHTIGRGRERHGSYVWLRRAALAGRWPPPGTAQRMALETAPAGYASVATLLRILRDGAATPLTVHLDRALLTPMVRLTDRYVSEPEDVADPPYVMDPSLWETLPIPSRIPRTANR